MPRLRLLAAALVAAAASSACYRVTVVSGAAPAAPSPANTLDKPWNNSFVFGLVPPPPVDASKSCPGGVSQVVTQRSFLNGLVAAITSSIYTPMQITVTCAGARTSSLGLTAGDLGVADAGAAPQPAPNAPAAPAAPAARP